MPELRYDPAADHPEPGRLPGLLVLPAAEASAVVWISDHQPRLPEGYVEDQPAA